MSPAVSHHSSHPGLHFQPVSLKQCRNITAPARSQQFGLKGDALKLAPCRLRGKHSSTKLHPISLDVQPHFALKEQTAQCCQSSKRFSGVSTLAAICQCTKSENWSK